MKKPATKLQRQVKPKHVKILVDSLETFAKLNYARDLAMDVFDTRLDWEEVKKEYMEEAKLAVKDYVFTAKDVDAIIKELVKHSAINDGA